MRVILPLLLCGVTATLAATTACVKDNCLRAVIANSFLTRHGSADCSAYLTATTIMAGIAVTTTITATVTDPTTVTLKARGNATPTIPAYATACSGAIRYSSACSCIGVTQVTVTVPPQTITVSATQTDASPTITKCANAQPTFAIQVSGDVPDPNGDQYNGNYAQVQNPGFENAVMGFFAAQLQGASVFTLNAAGDLFSGTFEANADPNQVFSGFYFNSPGVIVSNGFTPVVCSIDPSTSYLTYAAGSESILQDCFRQVYIGPSVNGPICHQSRYKAVPVCV